MFCQEQPNVVSHGPCERIAMKRLQSFVVLALFAGNSKSSLPDGIPPTESVRAKRPNR
jgi:hypothetical protein